MTQREWAKRVTAKRIMVFFAAIAAASGIVSLSWQMYSHFLPAPEVVDCYLEASFVEPERKHFELFLVVRNLGVKDVYLRHVVFDGEVLAKAPDPLLQEPIRPGEEERFNVGSYAATEISEWIDRMFGPAEDMLTYVMTTRDANIDADIKKAIGTLAVENLGRRLRGLAEQMDGEQ